MSNGNQHDHGPLPLILVGGASGRLQGNRHIITKEETPMANMLLGMLEVLGVHQDSFGDSTASQSLTAGQGPGATRRHAAIGSVLARLRASLGLTMDDPEPVEGARSILFC
jgi:hypothetical protein